MKTPRSPSNRDAMRAMCSPRVKSWPETFWGRGTSRDLVWPSEPYSAASQAGRLRVPHADPLAEGSRILTICNACRYCEGYCAVFPAMEHRQDFAADDLHYLANLCHNCAECYYACQYAPPHEFAVNVPKTFAEIRIRTYRKYAWPAFLSVNAAWTVVLGLIAAALLAGSRPGANANFY